MAGFNNKNKKERIYPVNQDTIRKFFKDTEPASLTTWFNRDFSSWMGQKGAYRSGLFIKDASYIPLPDNPNYENADHIWLDEDGNHADKDAPGARLVQCYKFSSLLNTDKEASYYIYAGAALDVFENEPPTKYNPLFDLDNVILSPHNAALIKGVYKKDVTARSN